MKLRLRPGFIRLRLRKADVHTLLNSGHCELSVLFGLGAESRLTYTLQLGSETSATYRSNQIVVSVAKTDAEKWANSDEVSIEVFQETGGEPLQILIEKDFACIDGDSVESQDDAYPNPLIHCGPSRD